MMLMLPFFYTSDILHMRHICAILELWGRPFWSSLLVSVFQCCYARNINSHSFVVTFHFFCSLGSPPVFIQPWTLNSRKCRLFRLHIQHATHYLFWTTNPSWLIRGSSLRILLSISLHHYDVGIPPITIEDVYIFLKLFKILTLIGESFFKKVYY